MPETAPCKECRADIEVNAQACPECGYNPGRRGKLSGIGLMIVGLLLSLTIIGAIVGIPLLIVGALSVFGSGDVTATGRDTDRPWWRKSFLELYRERTS